MTEEEAIKLLEGLGATPDEVALTLQSEGITGRVQSARHCPINNFLLKHGAHVGTCTVQTNVYLADKDLVPGHDDRIRVLLPEAVRQFVIRFDRLGYPDLKAEDYD